MLGTTVTDRNQGFEGLAFRPDAPARRRRLLPDPSAGAVDGDRRSLFDPAAPVRRSAPTAVVSRWSLSYEDLTAITWAEPLGRLLVIADAKDRLLVIRPEDGAVESELPIPGRQQEGLTLDASGALWIADDLDKSVLRIKDAADRPAEPAPGRAGGGGSGRRRRRRRGRQDEEEGRSLRTRDAVPDSGCRRACDGPGRMLDFAAMRLDSYHLRRASLALVAASGGCAARGPGRRPRTRAGRSGPGSKVSRPASDFELAPRRVRPGGLPLTSATTTRTPAATCPSWARRPSSAACASASMPSGSGSASSSTTTRTTTSST